MTLSGRPVLMSYGASPLDRTRLIGVYTQHYSHFFQRKSIYGPIAAHAISMIAKG
jgi:hypothetical protein